MRKKSFKKREIRSVVYMCLQNAMNLKSRPIRFLTGCIFSVDIATLCGSSPHLRYLKENAGDLDRPFKVNQGQRHGAKRYDMGGFLFDVHLP